MLLLGGVIKDILLWEYLDKSVYCANTIDLSLKKGGSTTCKTTRVQLSVKFRREFRRRFFKKVHYKKVNAPR